MEQFGESLKILREREFLSQEELAVRAEMSVATISKLERGVHKPSGKTRRRIAKAFGMDMEKFEQALGEVRNTTPAYLPRAQFQALTEAAKARKQTLADFIWWRCKGVAVRFIQRDEAEAEKDEDTHNPQSPGRRK